MQLDQQEVIYNVNMSAEEWKNINASKIFMPKENTQHNSP